jgi:hypothetical protein
MSKQRWNKKTTAPKPKSGRGIQRTSDLPDWSTRPAHGALEAFSSPSSSPPLPPLPSDKPARFQTPSRLETLRSPLTESVSRIARSVHDCITTPFNTVDTTHTNSELNSALVHRLLKIKKKIENKRQSILARQAAIAPVDHLKNLTNLQ